MHNTYNTYVYRHIYEIITVQIIKKKTCFFYILSLCQFDLLSLDNLILIYHMMYVFDIFDSKICHQNCK